MIGRWPIGHALHISWQQAHRDTETSGVSVSLCACCRPLRYVINTTWASLVMLIADTDCCKLASISHSASCSPRAFLSLLPPASRSLCPASPQHPQASIYRCPCFIAIVAWRTSIKAAPLALHTPCLAPTKPAPLALYTPCLAPTKPSNAWSKPPRVPRHGRSHPLFLQLVPGGLSRISLATEYDQCPPLLSTFCDMHAILAACHPLHVSHPSVSFNRFGTGLSC
jgi:hypothetical protein